MVLEKSLYSFMYNRKYSLGYEKSLQFPNFVLVEIIPIDRSIKLSPCVLVLFRGIC